MKRRVSSKPLALIALSASLAAGCATAPGPSAPARVDSSLDVVTQGGNRGARPTAQPETLAGDPYTKTAGGVEAAPREADPVVRFVAPSAPLTPAPPTRGGRPCTPGSRS